MPDPKAVPQPPKGTPPRPLHLAIVALRDEGHMTLAGELEAWWKGLAPRFSQSGEGTTLPQEREAMDKARLELDEILCREMDRAFVPANVMIALNAYTVAALSASIRLAEARAASDGTPGGTLKNHRLPSSWTTRVHNAIGGGSF